MFSSKTKSCVLTLKRKLSIAAQDSKPIEEFLQYVKKYCMWTCTRVGSGDRWDIVLTVLKGLSPEFREISTILRNNESIITYEKLYDKLIDFEADLKQHDASYIQPSINYAHRRWNSDEIVPEIITSSSVPIIWKMESINLMVQGTIIRTTEEAITPQILQTQATTLSFNYVKKLVILQKIVGAILYLITIPIHQQTKWTDLVRCTIESNG